MAYKLSSGALQKIFENENISNPVLQVLQVKSVRDSRHRLFLSDGITKNGSVMIASQLNHLVENKEIDDNCIIRLDKYVCNTVRDTKKVLVIFEIEVMFPGSVVGAVIGKPVLENALGNQTNGHGSAPQMEVDHPVNMPVRGPLPPMAASSPIRNNNTAEHISGVHPIASLTPYQNKWTICARVTSKSDIRKWNNAKGEGCLFSVNLLDESGEIRATAFKEQCDKYYNLMEVGKLYYVSQGQLKTANKQFSNLKNDYEMTFSSFTQVTPCHEDKNIPTMQFEFVTIDQIESIEKDSTIDVIGICKHTEELSTVTQKTTGKELKKRDLQLLDQSGREVRITIWGNQAENFDGSLNPILGLKGVRVSDFNGKSLSVLSSSTMAINPDIKEAHKLRAWYETTGSQLETVNLSNQRSGGSGMGSNFKTFGEAALEKLGSNQADYYTTKAIVSLIRKENSMYTACPAEGCNKKVIDMNNGHYRCEKCNKEFDSFNWRLMLAVSLADGTDNVWVTLFQEQAEALLSCTSEKLGVMKENNTDAFHAVFQEATFKEFIFKLRVKMETYNEESRLKSTVVTVQPLDFGEYNRRLIAEIKKMSDMS